MPLGLRLIRAPVAAVATKNTGWRAMNARCASVRASKKSAMQRSYRRRGCGARPRAARADECPASLSLPPRYATRLTAHISCAYIVRMKHVPVFDYWNDWLEKNGLPYADLRLW